MRISLMLVTVCAALSAGCEIPLAGFTCSVTGDRQASIATSGVTEIRVITGAGSLEIEGQANLGEVRASGTACASSQTRLDEVQLLTRRDGDVVVVETVTKHGRLDVSLAVPAALSLVVEDTSGSILVSDVSALDLDDGSGEIARRRWSQAGRWLDEVQRLVPVP